MRLATLDFETDPFRHGRVPAPFVAGFYDGRDFQAFWGDDCVARFASWLATKTEPWLIYAHNGGRFDFFFMLEHFQGELRIINSRIIQGHMGVHELRDSFAIMPFRLADYNKDSIDYDKLERGSRSGNRDEILSYLRTDCVALHELVTAFHAEFGDALTIGGAALKELRARHPFQSGGPTYDAKFRKQFYFGGRVEVFKAGIIKQPCRIYDVNSMYPYVMANYLHPVSTNIIVDREITSKTCFVISEGENYGAFPRRLKDGTLSFAETDGRFCCTIHEWNAAEATGTYRPRRVIKTYGFNDRISFSDFVTHFFGARQLAKFHGDKIHALFYKYVLNSAYGKFAQNPENFEEFQIRERTEDSLTDPWTPKYVTDDYIIWSKPTDRKRYYNICTGASITGGARAVLLRGLANAVNPLYCDTDSIICERMRDTSQLGESALGEWKLEASGDLAAIAGKKLYAIFDTTLFGNQTCIKKAHKGAALTPQEIIAIARGQVIRAHNEAPTFGLGRAPKFISRNIRRTAE